jgi:hypothetical protein
MTNRFANGRDKHTIRISKSIGFIKHICNLRLLGRFESSIIVRMSATTDETRVSQSWMRGE